MKRKDYIKPELAIVNVELQRMIAASPENVTLSTDGDPIESSDDVGSRDNGIFF